MTNFTPEILIISRGMELLENISSALNSSNLQNSALLYKNEDETLDFINENTPNVLVLDDEIENFTLLSKKIKAETEENIFIILLCKNQNGDEDFSGSIDAFVQKPVAKNILCATINSFLKIKKNIDKFKKDNKELNKSLYQLDVLYNTSSKLSGNLDRENLYEIMFETLEKTLSFDLASALIFPQAFENRENKLLIHSLKKPDETLLNVLKEKITAFAKENAPENLNNDFSKVAIEEFIKPSYENQNFDIKLLNFDKLMAPIQVKDKVFGMLLIYRNKPFLKEDVICFQSIVHQIASAIRAIVLYDEIKNTNVELKKLERIKSEFVSIVSHELRTPLTPINNSLEIVLSEDITETAKNFANMAKRNVSRLSGIIEDLLDLSRMETGKFDFKYAKYNIETSLDIIQKTFENQAKEKGIGFKMKTEPNLPEIYADFKRIEQILGNLVTNAVKFTQKGGNIEITTKTTDANLIDKNVLINPVENLCGKYVQISVKDTGVGIKEEDIHKIFDKFSQIENSLTRNAGGVGLGLTISKHFVDGHLGGIWVESKENEGSNFNVVIPVYSEKKAFEIDLNAAKKTNDTTCLLTFKAQNKMQNNAQNNAKETVLSLIQKLKEENIIKQLKSTKETGFEEPDTNSASAAGSFIYKICLSNLQKTVCDFTASQIQNYINTSNFKDCGIVLERAFFKKEDGNYSPGI